MTKSSISTAFIQSLGAHPFLIVSVLFFCFFFACRLFGFLLESYQVSELSKILLKMVENFEETEIIFFVIIIYNVVIMLVEIIYYCKFLP